MVGFGQLGQWLLSLFFLRVWRGGHGTIRFLPFFYEGELFFCHFSRLFISGPGVLYVFTTGRHRLRVALPRWRWGCGRGGVRGVRRAMGGMLANSFGQGGTLVFLVATLTAVLM